jgi:hypothetical protein
MQPYSNPTRRNMEDNLNIFKNLRQLIFLNGRRPQKNNATQNNNIFENGRRPNFF